MDRGAWWDTITNNWTGLTLSLSKRIVVYLVAGLRYLIQESMSVFPELGFDVFPDI